MIDKISSQNYEPLYINYNVSNQQTTNSQAPKVANNSVMSKEEMEKLMSFAMYKQTGISLRLVRTVGALYEGSNLNLLA